MGAPEVKGDFGCRGGTCDDATRCKMAGRCTYKSSAEEAREVMEKELKRPAQPLNHAFPLVTDVSGRKSETVVITDFAGKVDGGGYKASMDDPKKSKVWLVPAALLIAVAAVLTYGMRKYAANNWRKGMSWSEVYSAVQRHLLAWNEGEDTDPESGLNHLWHAACGLAFLIEYSAHARLYGRFDDRFKRPEGE